MHRRPARTAAFAVVLFVVGQLVALRHAAEERHVTCAEHGEQLESVDLGSTRDDGCGQSHLIGIDDTGDDHEECASARLLRTSTRTSEGLHPYVVVTSTAALELPAPIACTRYIDVILIAPKTSPPRLS